MKYYIKISLQHYAMGLIIPISIIWKLQSGLTLPQAVLTESIVLIVTALADLPSGFITDKISNKRSLIIGALAHFIAVVLLAYGGSLLVFAASAVFSGLGWAFVSGADEAYIHDDFLEDKKDYKNTFATSTIIDEASTILGMLTVSVVALLSSNLLIPLLISSAVLALHFFYTALILPKSRQLAVQHRSNTGKRMARNNLLKIFLLILAFSLLYESARPLWQPQLEMLNVPVASFGLAFAVFKVASILGSLFARKSNFTSRHLYVMLGVMPVSLVLFGAPLGVVSIFALCIFLFTENFFRIYMSTSLNSIIKKNRATMLSFASVVRNSTGALIILGAGFISSSSLFLAFIAIAAIKLPAILYVLREKAGSEK